MTFRVIIEEEAERELAEAVAFFERRKPGLGQRFARELQAFFNAVACEPARFALVSRLTRKARLPKPWPYSIYFVINPQTSEIVISTIWHGSRNPAKLRRRVK